MEDLVIIFANVVLFSAGGYVLLDEDYHRWLGSLAIVMALVYAVSGRVLLALKADDRQLVAAIAIASGFIAVAIPLEANASWVGLGWACEAGVLWWFGLAHQDAELATYWPALLSWRPWCNCSCTTRPSMHRRCLCRS